MAPKSTEPGSRRTVLKRIAGLGTAGITGIAGCMGGGGGGGSGNDSGNSGSGTNGGGGSGSGSTLKLAISGRKNSAHYTGAEMLAETVKEKSNGELNIDVICCQKAGGPPEIAKSVQQGTLDMGVSAVNNLAGITNAWLWVQLPYLWQDHRAMYTFFNEADIIDEVNQIAYQNLGNIRIKSYWGSNGGSMRHLHFTSKNDITVPSDASGQKMRVTESPIEKSTINTWGFSPSPIPWSETVSAMKQGVVDGIHIHYWWLYASGMYQQIDYTVETQTQDSPAALYINRNSWESLSKEAQTALDESLAEVTPKQISADIKQGNKGKTQIKEKSDIEIYQPTSDELNKWQQSAGAVYDEWLGKPGVERKFVKKALDYQDYSPTGVDI